MPNENVFMMFADCIPVKGAARSAIYDLSRRKLVSFASRFLPLIEQLAGRSLEEACAALSTEAERKTLRNLVDYLLANELGTWTRNPAAFPPISRQRTASARIHDAIVDVRAIKHDFVAIFAELDALGCKYVQIRAYSPLLSLQDLDALAIEALHKSILGLELLIPHDELVYPDERLLELMDRRRIISRLVVHTAPVDRVLASSPDEAPGAPNGRVIRYIQERVPDAAHCGTINSRNLSVPTTTLFTELLAHNGCLNRKIAIDELGQIKGCPAMAHVAGQFGKTSLAEAAASREITRWWDVAKDGIEVCKDCEFRYVCTDCRAHLSDPANPLSKPAKCSYDPYTGRWLDVASHERATAGNTHRAL